MKKYISILMLHVRSTFYKALAVFAVMMAVEFYFFQRQLNRVFPSDYTEDIYRQGLSDIFQDSSLIFVFLAAFLILTLILTLNGFEFKEKTSYTLRRLCLPEKHQLIVQGLYNSFVYFLFLAVQLLAVFLLSCYYMKTVPDTHYSNQTLFLIFYQNDFLHSLLPLEETVRVIRNILLILALGAASAFQSYTQRRGRKQGILLILIFGTIFFFSSPLGSFTGDAFLISASVTVLGIIIYNIIRKGDGYAV